MTDVISGEGGIRTHVPLRTNGFQDRLVMTTSIQLRANDTGDIVLYFFRYFNMIMFLAKNKITDSRTLSRKYRIVCYRMIIQAAQ